jgi:hypothetical protein
VVRALNFYLFEIVQLTATLRSHTLNHNPTPLSRYLLLPPLAACELHAELGVWELPAACELHIELGATGRPRRLVGVRPERVKKILKKFKKNVGIFIKMLTTFS